jgi:hypothetical protein
MCTQAHSTAFNAHSKALTHTQSAFNRVQPRSMLTQRRSRALRVHSTVFNHIQLCSSAFNTHSKAFTCTQAHSSTFTRVQWWSHSLKGIQSGQTAKGPIDMCLNMRSMRNPYIFAPNIRWMFFNIPWVDVIRPKTNDIKIQYWEGENLIDDQNNIDLT